MRRVVLLSSLLAALAGSVGGLGSPAASPRAAATVASYDLGVRRFPQPLPGKFARMPIRLWGVLGIPSGKGPFPVVVVAHGAASTGCPASETGDFNVWPCWDVEQRNDLGIRYVVRALAERGFVAIAPDLNASFTDGWGEPQEGLRFAQVLDATVSELARANRMSSALSTSLRGRLDLARLGVLGHSRGGLQAVVWSAKRASRTGPQEIAAGRGSVSALLLVEATYNTLEPPKLPDVPLTVVLGQCDGDVGLVGRRYYADAVRDPQRRAPVFKVLLEGANHVFFNSTWTALGRDDGAGVETPTCRSGRLGAAKQRAWLGQFSGDVFRQGFGISTAPWMRRGAPFADRLAGLPVAIDRWYPRS